MALLKFFFTIAILLLSTYSWSQFYPSKMNPTLPAEHQFITSFFGQLAPHNQIDVYSDSVPGATLEFTAHINYVEDMIDTAIIYNNQGIATQYFGGKTISQDTTVIYQYSADILGQFHIDYEHQLVVDNVGDSTRTWTQYDPDWGLDNWKLIYEFDSLNRVSFLVTTFLTANNTYNPQYTGPSNKIDSIAITYDLTGIPGVGYFFHSGGKLDSCEFKLDTLQNQWKYYFEYNGLNEITKIYETQTDSSNVRVFDYVMDNSITLSTAETTTTSTSTIFPNPTSSQFWFNDHAPRTGEIMELSGRTIERFEISSGESIDVSNYPVGLYLIRTDSDLYRLIVE